MSEAARDTLVSMLAEVARDYLQLRGTQTQLEIARANLATSRESLHLTKVRAEGGLTTELDVANAAAQVATTKASIPQLEQQQATLINELSFLLGEEPGALSAELLTPAPTPPVPPIVPIGLPSELAQRRPDIRQAEAQLHAETAQIGVAEANFYPSLTINGSFDLQAVKFSDLGSWASRTSTFGPSLSVPIFEGGRLTGNLELTKAEQQGAAIAYRRAVLNAWQEVANALAAYQAEQERQQELADAVAQNRRALDLARQQYTRGVADFLQVLIAQQQLLAAEQQNAVSIATVSTNLVTLYKALGGGWENALPRTASGSPNGS
jgi:NodT family efflux transporter outer membrane factor (OMF) lipoprotein